MSKYTVSGFYQQIVFTFLVFISKSRTEQFSYMYDRNFVLIIISYPNIYTIDRSTPVFYSLRYLPG